MLHISGRNDLQQCVVVSFAYTPRISTSILVFRLLAMWVMQSNITAPSNRSVMQRKRRLLLWRATTPLHSPSAVFRSWLQVGAQALDSTPLRQHNRWSSTGLASCSFRSRALAHLDLTSALTCSARTIRISPSERTSFTVIVTVAVAVTVTVTVDLMKVNTPP